MAEPADIAALAGLARETLLAELLPQVPEEEKYTALMVANALGIASWALAQGPAAGEAERGGIAALLGEDGDLPALRRALVSAIRAGRFDDDAALLAHLSRTVRGALAITNPKALAARDPNT